MFCEVFMKLMVLHAGTPVEISQATLMVMFVVLGIILVGVGFGRITKTKETLLQHRWTLTAAVALALIAVFAVMVPSTFRFYIDPDLMMFSNMSITTMIHGVIGVFAVATGVIYALGDLPVNVKKWMRVTAVLWLADIVVGVVLYLQMLELI